MKVSYTWLQDHIEEKLPSPEEVSEKIIFHAFEVESSDRVGDDTVFDIKVLPDRAGDSLSHYGIARELSGLFALTLKAPNAQSIASDVGSVPVDLQDARCRRYCAIKIEGVRVGPSPAWLRTKLETIGQKSINNIVDITNYILFDTGQPVHAFDAKEVDGGIVVRAAHKDEKIITLSNEEKVLQEGDLVIADYIGALAVAGVKGGKEAEVTEATTSIIIEVANFDPASVRKTSRRLALATDASKRFENNLSPESVTVAAARALALTLELAGGTLTGFTDLYPVPYEPRALAFSLGDITRILGETITAAHIENTFARYHYSYSKKDETYTLTVPWWRDDITGAHDIAEEVGRVAGYDAIPMKPLPFTQTVEQNLADERIARARAWCIAEGYREVYTYTFRKKGELSVAHGPKGKSALRANLSDGLQESYELNRLNAPLLGLQAVKLFEIGTVFAAETEEIHVAVIDRGVIQELPLDIFLKDKDTDALVLPEGFKAPIAPFAMWSPYPFITRDVAVWVQSDESEAQLETLVSAFAREHCARPPHRFDTFTKDGRTSVAYRFVFQSFQRTLTDEEVTDTFSKLLEQLRANPAFEVR